MPIFVSLSKCVNIKKENSNPNVCGIRGRSVSTAKRMNGRMKVWLFQMG